MLDDVKTLLGIDSNDRDKLLNLLIENAEKQLKARLYKPNEPLPVELEYIVVELTIIRYNRLGSEGMSAESVEGYSATYSQDDFTPYSFIIEQYIEDDEEDELGPRRGAIRAL